MDIEQSILPYLGRTMKMLDHYIEDQFSEAGVALSKLQFVTLKIISVNGNLPQNTVAQICGKDKTTFARNINTLERKQLVTRTVSTADKRIKLIAITPHGKQILASAKPVIERVVQEIETNITASDKAQLKAVLQKIRTNLPNAYTQH